MRPAMSNRSHSSRAVSSTSLPDQKRRRSPRPSTRTRGYAGMPREEWADWRHVAETFCAERSPRRPELVEEVLVLVLGANLSWRDLLGAGWVRHATTQVYVAAVPGFAEARTLALLDRFVAWLAERGDLTPWQRQSLATAVDAARAAQGLPSRHARHVREHYLRSWKREAEQFAGAVEEPWLRELVPGLMRVLDSQLALQLGPGTATPLGCLDADAMLADVFAQWEPGAGAREADRSLFMLAASYYRWLAETERLERRRAQHIAQRFATAALSLTLSAA